MAWSSRFDFCVRCGSSDYEHQARGLCVKCYKVWLRERFPLPEAATSWCKQHDRCWSCGTADHPHQARGLCVVCYQALSERRHRGEHTEAAWRRKVHLQFSREDLVRAYEVEELSLSEIAKRYGCTRQAIYAHFKKLGVQTRGYSTARSLAIAKGKVRNTRTSDDGVVSSVQLQAHVFNRAFFKKWTREMAYVLGVIYTDGNISDRSGDFRVSIGQKEPELLLKVRELLRSNAQLQHSRKKGIRGELHVLQFSDREVHHDLCRIGLTPRKSRSMLFPKVPSRLVRHFIRGCWDGDGTVYIDGRGRGNAAFGSGSKAFVDAMLARLLELGLPRVTVYEESRSSGYWYFRFHGKHCEQLFHVLYDDTDESTRLSRKYDLLKAIAQQIQQ